jgi:hypothetical protein
MPESTERAALSHLGDLAAALGAGALMTGPAGELRYASPGACTVLGCIDQTALERDWTRLRALLRSADEAGLVEVAGRRIAVEVRPGAGEHEFILLRDVARLDRLETDAVLAASLRWLMDENRLSAHDVRAPLNAVQLSLELLVTGLADEPADDGGPPKWQRHVSVIREELGRLNRLLDAALDQKELVSGRAVDLDFRGVLGQVVRVLGYEARRRRVKLQVHQPECELRMSAPPGRLKAALFQVLHSQMCSVPDGTTLQIGAAKLEDAVEVRITGGAVARPAGSVLSSDAGECFVAKRIFQSLGGGLSSSRDGWRITLPSGTAIAAPSRMSEADKADDVGRSEQKALHEDPAILMHGRAPRDAGHDRLIAERRDDHLRQAFRQWWQGLSREQTSHYEHRRDELLLLLHEKYRYTRDEASREADRLLGASR